MNSYTKKLLDLCCITAILLLVIVWIGHIIKENDCQAERSIPSELLAQVNVDRDHQRNVIYDIKKQEIMNIKNENNLVTQEENVSIEKESEDASENESNLQEEEESSVIFEDGRVLDCSFLKGINKTEMFGRNQPYMSITKDNTENRTFFTCNNCSR